MPWQGTNCMQAAGSAHSHHFVMPGAHCAIWPTAGRLTLPTALTCRVACLQTRCRGPGGGGPAGRCQRRVRSPSCAPLISWCSDTTLFDTVRHCSCMLWPVMTPAACLPRRVHPGRAPHLAAASGTGAADKLPQARLHSAAEVPAVLPAAGRGPQLHKGQCLFLLLAQGSWNP